MRGVNLLIPLGGSSVRQRPEPVQDSAPPWAPDSRPLPGPPGAPGLLDRTRPLPWRGASGSEGMGRGELSRTGADAQHAA